jgi:hypothetical protein
LEENTVISITPQYNSQVANALDQASDTLSFTVVELITARELATPSMLAVNVTAPAP